METNEKKFIEGFNSGYMLSQHEPDLFAMLQKKLEPSNDYIQGIVAGGKEYEMEKATPQRDLNKSNKSPDKEIDRER